MEKLIRLLHKGNYSLVVAHGEIRTFSGRGVSDLYALSGEDPGFLRGASVADKVVGKAAAALMIVAGLTAARCRRVSLPLLAAVVLGYQAIGTLGEWAMTGSLRAALQDFRIGLPGMSLQILGGWAFMRWMLRR